MVAIGRALMSNPEVLLCDEISLGLAPVALGPADPARLREGAQRWGHYYRHGPQVMAGYVPPGHRRLSDAGWLHPAPGYGDPEVRHDVVA